MLEIIHIDLFISSMVPSLGDRINGLVFIKKYLRYSWLYFLVQKNKILKDI